MVAKRAPVSWPWPNRPFGEWSAGERAAFCERYPTVAFRGHIWLSRCSVAELRDAVAATDAFRAEWQASERQRVAALDPVAEERREERRWARRNSEEDFWSRLDVSPALRDTLTTIQQQNEQREDADQPSDLWLACQRYFEIRRTYMRTLRGSVQTERGRYSSRGATRVYEGHVSYEQMNTLENRERALLQGLRRHEGSIWDLVTLLRGEIDHFERLLNPTGASGEWLFGRFYADAVDDIEPAPPVTDRRGLPVLPREPRHVVYSEETEIGLRGWLPLSERKRPIFPKYETPPAAPVARPMVSQQRTARNEKIDARVLHLLARNPDGLSRNLIQKRLKAGRHQVVRALERLLRAGSVEHVHNGNDSRYVHKIQVGRQGPPKSDGRK